MRILITNTGPWGTGSGTVADGVMQELRRRGHEVMAFFPDAGFLGTGYQKYYGDSKSYHIVKFPATYNGVHLYTFPLIIRDPNPRNYENAWTFKDLSPQELEAYFGYMQEELEKVIDDFKPDIIECQHIWALDHLINKIGSRYVCVAHHSDQLGFLFDKRMQQTATQSAQKADYIFAISDYVKKEVIDLYSVHPQKVVVTGNGYDQSIFRPVKNLNRQKVLSRFGYNDLQDYPIVTFCGKISYTKGVDVLLEANKIIQEKMKVNIFLMGSGNLENFSKKDQEKFHMENVFVLGHQNQQDLSLLHNISALSVLPSRSEGFGIAALEAMGCKKPVVVTKVGGLHSFAQGRFIEKENPQELANAVLGILNMKNDDYEKLCKQALLAARKYSWQNIVDIRMDYYEKEVFSQDNVSR